MAPAVEPAMMERRALGRCFFSAGAAGGSAVCDTIVKGGYGGGECQGRGMCTWEKAWGVGVLTSWMGRGGNKIK